MSDKLLDQTSARAFRAAKLRYFFMVGAIVVITVACASILIYQHNKKNRLIKIANEYSEIDSQYFQENLQESNNSPNSQFSIPPSADHAKSMALFTQFAKKYAKEPYGWQAGIRAINYDINQGNLQAAKELLEIIIPYTYKFSIIQIKFRTLLASIFAEQNDAQNAIQQIEFINEIPKNPLLDQTRFFAAQILYVFGKTSESAQILKAMASEEAKIWLGFET